MINFNRNGLQAKFGANNYFYGQLPSTRQTLFKRAFNLLPEKAPVLRYQRDDKGGVKKETGVNYQENLLEARLHVQSMLETYATLMGATLSQVVYAVVVGDEERFADVVFRRIQGAVQIHYEMIPDKDGVPIKTRRDTLNLPHGHTWKGNPNKIERADVLRAIGENWVACGGLMTQYEAAAEGGEAALIKLKTEQKSKSRSFNTSRKDSMKGVQVVNARQAAHKAAVAGG